MVNITAGLVKELREKTGAGMMDCKKALLENEGDLTKSIDWLRKKGHAAAAKKAGRATAEGLVGVAVKENSGVVIELNSETDFVARNEKFQNLMKNVLQVALNCNTIEDLEAAKYTSGDKSVKDSVAEHVGIVGENLSLKRFQNISVNKGVVSSYVHNSMMQDAGKIAVLVAIESDADSNKLHELGKQIAMHIAAARPEAMTKEEVSAESVEREKQIFSEQARASGKPDNIIEKMVIGRLQKYYQEVVLLEQVFVMDNKTKIADLVNNFAKEVGKDVKIKGFVRYELGAEVK
ncbi:MAG: translation elongation factor Ts [Alphaproteobacteria bacterium]|nr:translation elongation factor Ts [Alphaproteobacteria bacterium]